MIYEFTQASIDGLSRFVAQVSAQKFSVGERLVQVDFFLGDIRALSSRTFQSIQEDQQTQEFFVRSWKERLKDVCGVLQETSEKVAARINMLEVLPLQGKSCRSSDRLSPESLRELSPEASARASSLSPQPVSQVSPFSSCACSKKPSCSFSQAPQPIRRRAVSVPELPSYSQSSISPVLILH